MKFFGHLRSRAGIAAVSIVAVATSAGAATVHRLAVTQGTGSEGATAFVQSSGTSSALQGEVNSSPNTSLKIPFGVLGDYDLGSSSTFGIGVAGISTTGYGVGAESFSAGEPSLIALNTAGGNGAEAYGESTSTLGNYGFSQGSSGLLAGSTNGNAIQASTSTDGVSAIYSEDDAGTSGVAVTGVDTSPQGFGLFGVGSSGLGADSETPGQYFPAVYAQSFTPGTELIDGILAPDTSSYGNEVFAFTTPSENASQTVDPQNTGVSTDLQINGDIYLNGHVFAGCAAAPQETDPVDDCTTNDTSFAKSSNGTKYVTYAAKHASETLEDEGEARLVNGYAHVALDPAYASTISTAQPYLVFTTPMGESRGLYVANRTATGFDVRENAAGRSSMTFDYRIVAHPYGVRTSRMAPMVHRNVAKHPMSAKVLARMRFLQHMHGRAGLKSHVMPRSFASYTRTSVR